MQVVVCNQVGSLDQLVVEERPSPDLYPTCVRIAVTACGVNGQTAEIETLKPLAG